MYTKFVSEQNSQRGCPAKRGVAEAENGGNHVPGREKHLAHKVDSNDNGINRCPIMSSMAGALQKERQGNGVAKCDKDAEPKGEIKQTSDGCTKCNCCSKQAAADKAPPVRSASGNYLSQEGSPRNHPGRKTSNISYASAGSDEVEGEKKLDLRSLIEGIGTLLIPVVCKFYYDYKQICDH